MTWKRYGWMRYSSTVRVPRGLVTLLNRAISEPDPALPHGELIFEIRARFTDDCTMIIRVVSANDPETNPGYAEAVLLTRGGDEVDAILRDTVEGDWVIQDGESTYTATIEAENRH